MKIKFEDQYLAKYYTWKPENFMILLVIFLERQGGYWNTYLSAFFFTLWLYFPEFDM